MTRRITCYVVYATLIWSAHAQDEEQVRGNMFKSNMTRNDFSKLLSSLIKLNEQRVNVLQKLYKLEDYGVLSEVLRSGDRKPENGNPNNLFLIVMSKNETAPSRRQLNFEVVDTVKSLDIGSQKVNPKLDYVLDPAGYISQKNNKNKPIQSIFDNIPMIHGPKKTYSINDGSKKNIKRTIKPLKYRKPHQNTKEKDNASIIRNKKTGLRTNKEMKNRGKIEILSEESNATSSQELGVYDENNKTYSPIGNSNLPHVLETYVTKINVAKKSNNNHTYRLEAKDQQGGNDYDSSFSEEYMNKSFNDQDAKAGHISIKTFGVIRNNSILNNQDNRYTIYQNKKTSSTKNDRRDTSKNEKNNFEDKDQEDESYYEYPSNKEYNDNDSNRQYTLMNIDTSIKNVNDIKTPKAKINVMRVIKTTTNKNYLISTVINSKTNSLDTYNKKKSSQNNDEEDEYYYGSPFSEEYDEISQSRKNITKDNPKKNILDKQNPILNGIKSILNILDSTTTTSTKKTAIAIFHAKNDTLFNTLNGVNTIKNDYTEPKKKINHSNKFPSQATHHASYIEIPVTVKVLPDNHDHEYTKDIGNGTNHGDQESKSNTNRDSIKPLARIMAIENIDDLAIPRDPKLNPKYATKNSNKNKMKISTENFDIGITSNDESKKHKDHDGKETFNESGEFVIDKMDREDFSIVVSQVVTVKPEQTEKPTDLRIETKKFDNPDEKPIERKAFQKCMNKKAKKLCSKSCISAYKNVCQRLKCTSKAKKALKKECKRSCKKVFASSSSKYSDETNSDESNSDDSHSDDSDSDSSYSSDDSDSS